MTHFTHIEGNSVVLTCIYNKEYCISVGSNGNYFFESCSFESQLHNTGDRLSGLSNPTIGFGMSVDLLGRKGYPDPNPNY